MAWRSGVQATMDYFDEHLQTGDYYLDNEQEIEPALWLGEGAERLGLTAQVSREDFESLANNLHPETGGRLTARMNSSDNRRTFWDVAVSPPKDVSVLAALGDEQTRKAIRQLHREASEIAGREMERYLGVRERKNGANHTKIGNVEAVIASVIHDTARPVAGIPDPHLHTHLLFANAVYDQDNEQWKAMSNEGAVEAQRYLRQAYYNEMVRGLEKLGYKCETREHQNDFVISGMSRDLIDAFSRRHNQVRDLADEKMKLGMKDRKLAEELAVLEARESKVTLSQAQLESGWAKVAGVDLIDGFNQWNDLAKLGKVERSEGLDHLDQAQALDHAKDHVFTNVSVTKEHEVLADVLRRGRGNMSLNEAKEALQNDPDFFKSGEYMTTRQVIVEEEKMIQLVESNLGTHAKMIPDEYEIKVSPPGEDWEYSAEQIATVKGVLENTDLIVGVNGVAGAGKTTLLEEIERGIKAGNKNLVPLAPTGQAVGILRKEGFEDADTLQQWLVNPKLREQTKGATLAVDESGMVGTTSMLDLLEKAIENENRIILVGDIKQIQSVSRGDAFRLLQERTAMITMQVTETRRQKTEDYKDVVGLVRAATDRKQWATAWTAFERMDAITEMAGDDQATRYDNLIGQAAKAYQKNDEQLIVTSRWSTIHDVNGKIRADLIDQGKLGEERIDKIALEPVHLSAVEKARTASYRQGQKLELIRDIAGIGKKGEVITVESRSSKGLITKNETGVTQLFHQRKHRNDFQIFNERNVNFREGDKLLIKANTDELKNGQIVELIGIKKNGELTVKDQDGKQATLDRDFKHAFHGYAVTAHSSQGATVDDVLVLGDGMTKEQFYVAATRGKTGIEVLATDRQRLEMAVAVSGERKSALDIVDAKRVRLEQEKAIVDALKARIEAKSTEPVIQAVRDYKARIERPMDAEANFRQRVKATITATIDTIAKVRTGIVKTIKSPPLPNWVKDWKIKQDKQHGKQEKRTR